MLKVCSTRTPEITSRQTRECCITYILYIYMYIPPPVLKLTEFPDTHYLLFFQVVHVYLIVGCQLCMGHAVDQNLLSLVQQDVKKLIMDYKITEESLAQQRVDLTAVQNTVTSIQDQQSATRAQLKDHDEELAVLLEWKEQQTKENEEVLAKLVSVDEMLTEELLIRVERVEKGLDETGDKVEQLERGFDKRDDKVEQLEQGFAKTDDKVEQLQQGFAKTADKLEQLEQGFAKTDDKVEQLEQGFAKVEKDMSERSNQVKQLEEAFRSQMRKENKPG